jgi:hypothetical protein
MQGLGHVEDGNVAERMSISVFESPQSVRTRARGDDCDAVF